MWLCYVATGHRMILSISLSILRIILLYDCPSSSDVILTDIGNHTTKLWANDISASEQKTHQIREHVWWGILYGSVQLQQNYLSYILTGRTGFAANNTTVSRIYRPLVSNVFGSIGKILILIWFCKKTNHIFVKQLEHTHKYIYIYINSIIQTIIVCKNHFSNNIYQAWYQLIT